MESCNGTDNDIRVCRHNSQDVGNILGALYLAMLFLGIINSRTVLPPTSYERSVRITDGWLYQRGDGPLPCLLSQPTTASTCLVQRRTGAMVPVVLMRMAPRQPPMRGVMVVLACQPLRHWHETELSAHAFRSGDVPRARGGHVRREALRRRPVPGRAAL